MASYKELITASSSLSTEILNKTYTQIGYVSSGVFFSIAIYKYFTYSSIFLVGSFFLVSLLCFLLSRLFNRDIQSSNSLSKLLLLLVFVIAISLDFILNGGIYSPAIYLLFPIVIIIRFLIELKRRILITVVIFSVYTALVIFEYYWPQFIISREPQEPSFNIERTVSFLLSLTFMLLLINKILNQYTSSKEQAIKSEKVKSEFLEIMSHMIRTPLNSINGFGDLLLHDDFSEDQQKDFIQRMKKNADTLRYLISDLSDLAIIQDQGLKLHPTKFTIRTLLLELSEKADELIGMNPNKIDIINPVSEEIMNRSLLTDYQRLLQILWYVLQNGIKFTKDGSVTIKVDFQDGEDMMKFCISDTGIGMTKKEHEQLFLLINKQNAGFNIHDEGTGLGLNIAQGILENMDGKIEIESAIGVGTQVNIYLPHKIIV